MHYINIILRDAISWNIINKLYYSINTEFLLPVFIVRIWGTLRRDRSSICVSSVLVGVPEKYYSDEYFAEYFLWILYVIW